MSGTPIAVSVTRTTQIHRSHSHPTGSGGGPAGRTGCIRGGCRCKGEFVCWPCRLDSWTHAALNRVNRAARLAMHKRAQPTTQIARFGQALSIDFGRPGNLYVRGNSCSRVWSSRPGLSVEIRRGGGRRGLAARSWQELGHPDTRPTGHEAFPQGLWRIRRMPPQPTSTSHRHVHAASTSLRQRCPPQKLPRASDSEKRP